MSKESSGLTVCTLLALLCLAGCHAGTELAATEVLNDSNCKGVQDGLRKVSFADVAALRGSTLLSISGPTQSVVSTPTAEPELLLFSLSKGRQPSPGYYFRLTDARLVEGVAELTLRWVIPEPESVQAQVITYPCIVIGVEADQYGVVRAVDDDGVLLGELRI